ncbi:MAG: hypothetical protein OXQ92_16110 [Boseongicola sp.]|nr:hypothetical protein [Boseongicola sp.]MDD9978390.1 hypothetical protein [Boseongicola sp.]
MYRLLPLMALVTIALAFFALREDPGLSGPALYALPVAVLVLIALFRMRPKKAVEAHRFGFLTHSERPALSHGERLNMIGMTIERPLPVDKPEGHPDFVVMHEIHKLAMEWRTAADDADLSDDELRSLYQLYMYADPADRPKSRLPEQYLRDVREPAVFNKLRRYSEDWREEQAKPEVAFEAWLEEVGDPDMNHLLLNGWVRFLESLPGNDIKLWHAIATDFDNLDERDRLDAVFWILEQPDCDFATANDVIRGYIYWGVLEDLARKAAASGKRQYVSAFANVINRLNDGFYTRHSLPASSLDKPGPEFDLDEMGHVVAEISKATGMPLLPKPRGLVLEPAEGVDAMPDGYTSPYDYAPDAGLFLKFPGSMNKAS